MPPRLPFLGLAAPSSFITRLARPFTTTVPRCQVNEGANFFLNLEKASRTPEGARPRTLSFTREKIQARTEAVQARQRREAESLRDRKVSEDYQRNMHRRWKAGDVYAPHDLNPHQINRFRSHRTPREDIIDSLGVSPLDLYKNFSMITEFTTSAGNIRNRKSTGLRAKNQRKMAKAIRRMQGMGLHPSVHAHPEILIKRQGGNF